MYLYEVACFKAAHGRTCIDVQHLKASKFRNMYVCASMSFHSWAWLKILRSVNLEKYLCTAEYDKNGIDSIIN